MPVHTLATVANTPPDLTIRYAALFHDIAKGLPGIRGVHKGRYTDYGHDAKGAELAEASCCAGTRNRPLPSAWPGWSRRI